MTLCQRMAGFPCKQGNSPISPFSNWRVLTKHSRVCVYRFPCCLPTFLTWKPEITSEYLARVKQHAWMMLVCFTALKSSQVAASRFYGCAWYIGLQLAGLFKAVSFPGAVPVAIPLHYFRQTSKQALMQQPVAWWSVWCLLSCTLIAWRDKWTSICSSMYLTHGEHVHACACVSVSK